MPDRPGLRIPLPIPTGPSFEGTVTTPGGETIDVGSRDELNRVLEGIVERARAAQQPQEPGAPDVPEIPVEDSRVTGGSGSDEVFDLYPSTGLELPSGGPPIPLPDPGSIDWRDFSVTFPGDGPVLVERATRRRVGRLIPGAFPQNTSVADFQRFQMNIVAPNPQRVATPFPNEPIRNVPQMRVPPVEPVFRRSTQEERIVREIVRDRAIREAAERLVRDSARRQAGRVIEGEVLRRGGGAVLGPLGGIIGAAIPAGELGSGELIPGFEAPMPEPPVIAPPVITQPQPLPLPPPPTPEMKAPWPTSSPPTSAPAPSPTTGGTPTPQRSPRPTSTPSLPRVPWSRILSGIILSRFGAPSSSTGTRPSLTNPFTAPSSSPSPAPTTPGGTSALPQPLPLPVPNPLTGFQPSVQSSGPPAVRTRTRTRECRCDERKPKRKKRRECIARGQLVWASGPKKGKPAGSRCISFRGGK